MISDPDEPIEHELLRQATLAEIAVTETRIEPTPADDKHVRLAGRLGLEEDEDGEPVDDVEHYAFGFIYALGMLSFLDARPRGSRASTSRRRISGARATCCDTCASKTVSSTSTRTTSAVAA